MKATEVNEKIQKFKEDVIQRVNEEAIENIFVHPQIEILCDSQNDEKPTIAIIPIPNELLESDETKDILADNIIPNIIKEIIKDGLEPLCLAMITEGWSYHIETKEGRPITREGWEAAKARAEKKEMVIISFDEKETSESRLFIKKGTKKNEAGEYIEQVWLEEDSRGLPDASEGRFIGLLKKSLAHA